MKQIHSIFSRGLQCYYHNVAVKCLYRSPVNIRPSSTVVRPLLAVVIIHCPFPLVTGVHARLSLQFAARPLAVLLL